MLPSALAFDALPDSDVLHAYSMDVRFAIPDDANLHTLGRPTVFDVFCRIVSIVQGQSGSSECLIYGVSDNLVGHHHCRLRCTAGIAVTRRA